MENGSANVEEDEAKEAEAAEKMKRRADIIRRTNEEDRPLLYPIFIDQTKRSQECAEHNQKIIELIVNSGVHMLDNSNAIKEAFNMTKLRPSSEHYMSKVKSTLKQIVRDWSAEGAKERESCYNLVHSVLVDIYPKFADRHNVHVLVTGAGLARFAWELLQMGFSVQGNEFSIFMLLTSNFILNTCQQVDEFTIYPYLLDFSNSWSFEDQIRPVKFPDVSPCTSNAQERLNTFSMCAGDFLQAYAEDTEKFDCVASIFFLDTAANPMSYIRAMYRILKPGGVWLNFGPLTYHFEDTPDESLELHFEEIVRIVGQCGFRLDKILGKDQLPSSLYTCNPNSMLQYTYHCGFFQCTKIINGEF